MERSKQIIKKIKAPKVPAIVTPRYKLPVSLRTPRDERHYFAEKKRGKAKRPLLEEPRMKEWEYWALIANDFPYSAAFKTHHMLIPKRLATKQELTVKELSELNKIIDELSETYDCWLVNYSKKQSITNHFHVHFLVYKDKRKELKL